jgi:hypothetical protein
MPKTKQNLPKITNNKKVGWKPMGLSNFPHKNKESWPWVNERGKINICFDHSSEGTQLQHLQNRSGVPAQLSRSLGFDTYVILLVSFPLRMWLCASKFVACKVSKGKFTLVIILKDYVEFQSSWAMEGRPSLQLCNMLYSVLGPLAVGSLRWK